MAARVYTTLGSPYTMAKAIVDKFVKLRYKTANNGDGRGQSFCRDTCPFVTHLME